LQGVDLKMSSPVMWDTFEFKKLILETNFYAFNLQILKTVSYKNKRSFTLLI